MANKKNILFYPFCLSVLLPSLLHSPQFFFHYQKGLMLILMKIFYWFALDTELCNANTNLWAVHFPLGMRPKVQNKEEKVQKHMPRSPTSPKTDLQACALTASQLDFAMVLPYGSYVVSEPNPLNLSCPSSPECRQRESMGVCACHCRNVPRVLSTAGMVQWRLEPSWIAMDTPSLGDLLAWNPLGIVAHFHLQILLSRSIYEWSSVREVHFS